MVNGPSVSDVLIVHSCSADTATIMTLSFTVLPQGVIYAHPARLAYSCHTVRCMTRLLSLEMHTAINDMYWAAQSTCFEEQK